MSDPIKLIYVESAGHSGSTLLELLIGGHSQAVTVGAVKRFATAPDGRCSCVARTVWECPFWTRVNDVFTDDMGFSLREIDMFSDDDDTFIAHNRGLLEAVRTVSGKRYIVESSKSHRRLSRLLETAAVDILPVNIIRRPHGVVYSQVKKDRNWLQFAINYTREVTRAKRILAAYDHVAVRYEELASNPAEVVAGIMARAGLEFEDQQLDWAGRERHNFGGNRMRRGTDSTIRIDDAWQEKLTGLQKLGVSIVTWPVRH